MNGSSISPSTNESRLISKLHSHPFWNGFEVSSIGGNQQCRPIPRVSENDKKGDLLFLIVELAGVTANKDGKITGFAVQPG